MSKEKTNTLKCHVCKKTIEDDYVALINNEPHCFKCAFEIGYKAFAPSNDNESSKKLGSILKDAYKIINGNRQNSYGTPEDSFARISDYWNTYLKHKNLKAVLTPKDVAMMMVLFKIARLGHSYTYDSCVDICGYTAIYDSMFDNDKK